MCACACVCVCVCVCVCKHVNTHTYTHTHIHTDSTRGRDRVGRCVHSVRLDLLRHLFLRLFFSPFLFFIFCFFAAFILCDWISSGIFFCVSFSPLLFFSAFFFSLFFCRSPPVTRSASVYYMYIIYICILHVYNICMYITCI